MNVANRVSAAYSDLDVTTDPPTVGATTQTTISNHPASAAKYGILERVLAGGTRTSGEADQVRDTYLAEMALPVTDRRFSTSGDSPPSITLEVLGYVHRTQAWVYEDATTGTTQIDIKMPLVIDADPNELFDSTNANLAANAVLCTRYDAENRTGWSVIKSLIAYGGAADERYLWGVYADRRITYVAMPTDIVYHQNLADPLQRITTPEGEPIKPWNVLPGRWVLYPDYMIGFPSPADPRDDSRALFIERLTYTMPTTLQLEGGRVKTMDQLLAKMGLGGI